MTAMKNVNLWFQPLSIDISDIPKHPHKKQNQLKIFIQSVSEKSQFFLNFFLFLNYFMYVLAWM